MGRLSQNSRVFRGNNKSEIIDFSSQMNHIIDMIILARGGDDIITAGSGDDIIIAGRGNDVVDSGGGDDRVLGGKGNDILQANAGSDTVLGQDGNDTLIYDFDLQEGDDFDFYHGGRGNDTLHFKISQASMDALGVSEQELLDSFGKGKYVDFSGLGINLKALRFENFNLEIINDGVKEGTDGDDYLVGDENANIIHAGKGNDIIEARGGDDILRGGEGNDVLVGEGGQDLYFGGEGDDFINDLGGNESDTLYGEAGADGLNGGGGADIMRGGAGDDSYSVDNVGDVVDERLDYAGDFSNANDAGGTDFVESFVSFTLPQFVEWLTLRGEDNIDATGNALGNIIIGNSGDNLLNGAAGNDGLVGMEGNDILVGGSGNDVFESANQRPLVIDGELVIVDGEVQKEIFALGEDVVSDFVQGEDKIAFNEYALGVDGQGNTIYAKSIADVTIGAGTVNGTAYDVVVSTALGDKVALEGYNDPNLLNPDDFVFFFPEEVV